MSIERELLEKVISGDNKGDFFVSYDLYKEIYKFLAQHKENYVEMLPSELWLDGYEAGKKSALLSKQPEQEPVAWKDRTYGNLHHVDYGNSIPLYISPPKREPLSDEAVCEILIKKEWKGFVELVRLIEKAHGIGGGE